MNPGEGPGPAAAAPLPGLTLRESSLDSAQVWRGRIRVEPASPFFDGHFESRPILPGIAQLALVFDAVGGRSGGRARVVGIRSLRWRKLVGPGDSLDLRVEPADADGEVRFEIRLEGSLVSAGVLVVAREHDG
jgi:3-hydroxyacyl-[acyl-carrier-protein] dehydratase